MGKSCPLWASLLTSYERGWFFGKELLFDCEPFLVYHLSLDELFSVYSYDASAGTVGEG